MTLLYVLLLAHFIGDFVCQSDWMAINKSKSWSALAVHVWVYMIVLSFVTPVLMVMVNGDYSGPSIEKICLFYGVNAAAHFVQDAITSRVNSRLWQANARHWFFVGIGFDQLLHYMTLFVTANWWLR